MIDKLFHQYIARLVVVMTTLLLPFVTAGAVWVQEKIGIDLDPSEMTAFIVTYVVGVVSLVYKWLHNRGEWEIATRAIDDVFESGLDALGADDPDEVLKVVKPKK